MSCFQLSRFINFQNAKIGSCKSRQNIQNISFRKCVDSFLSFLLLGVSSESNLIGMDVTFLQAQGLCWTYTEPTMIRASGTLRTHSGLNGFSIGNLTLSRSSPKAAAIISLTIVVLASRSPLS